MGTTWEVQVVLPAASPACPEPVEDLRAPLERAVRTTLGRVVGDMSQWEPQSALSRFNHAPIGEWRTLPHQLCHVLDAALAIGRATDGAFDPAAGVLADLWGFGVAGRRRDVPADAEVGAALIRSGAAGIERGIGRTRRTRDVALDLSGIGKGYAVDAVAAALRTCGVSDFLVEIGGEFIGSGIRPDGQPWWVELEVPPGLALPPFRVALHGLAVATSGDYRRFIADGARRLGHTLDPRTGRPVANGVVSVSVLAADCMTADGWATALTVLGPQDGMAAAERERLAARIVTQDGRERLSSSLAAMLD